MSGPIHGTYLDSGVIREIPILVDQYGRPLVNLLKLAGERQPDSLNGADHLAIAPEGAVKKVVYTDGDTTIWPGPALLFGFRITTALSAHAWSFDDNATARVDIPASAAAGIYSLPCATIFETSLVCNVGTSASAGVVEVYFRPLDSSTTWAY